MASLPSTINNETIRREIATAASQRFGPKGNRLVYEHGHWWLSRSDGSQYDVVDVENSVSNQRFDFEEVTPPDED